MRSTILISAFALFASVATIVWADQATKPCHKDGPKHQQHHHKKGHHLFKRMDTDGDGVITTEEHEAALSKSQEKRRQHFAGMDINGDGSLTKEEAQQAKEAFKERRKNATQAQEESEESDD